MIEIIIAVVGILIGGGIGITPMLSMLETLADDKDSRQGFIMDHNQF